jgi:hypothetical protein
LSSIRDVTGMALGLQTLHDLGLALFNPFFVRFFPHSRFANILEFEHATDLLSVECAKTPYQHFFHQFYDDPSPLAIWLASRPKHQARHQRGCLFGSNMPRAVGPCVRQKSTRARAGRGGARMILVEIC